MLTAESEPLTRYALELIFYIETAEKAFAAGAEIPYPTGELTELFRPPAALKVAASRQRMEGVGENKGEGEGGKGPPHMKESRCLCYKISTPENLQYRYVTGDTKINTVRSIQIRSFYTVGQSNEMKSC
jgi:hypothetical protein